MLFTYENFVYTFLPASVFAGKLSVFAEGLPGGCDNIRLNSRGTYWVGIDIARSADNPMILDKIAPYPLIAKATMRLCWLIGRAFESLASVFKHPTMRDLAADVSSTVALLPFVRMVTSHVGRNVLTLTRLEIF